jgi:hypothetical protein
MGWQGGLWPVSGHRTCRRAVLKRTVKSCGPDASVVGVKSADGKSARPGADEPAIRRRRRQQSPILRGERVISRQAIAQGMSDRLRCPVCSCAIFVLPFARETAGAARIRHSLLPLLRDNETQASGRSCRENADAHLLFEIRIETLEPSLPATNAKRLRKGALATTASAVARRAKEEAIHLACLGETGLLRGADRNDDLGHQRNRDWHRDRRQNRLQRDDLRQ